MCAETMIASDKQSPATLPAWLRIPGWIALLGLVLAPPFPRLEAPINLAGGLGLLALLGILLAGKVRLLPDARMRWGLSAFLGACVLSIVVPNLSAWPDTGPIAQSLHEFWNLVNAITAAGLILALARTPRERLALIFLFSLVMVMIAVGVPLERWLAGKIHLRVTGTKGGANRYAILVFVSALWLLLLEVHRWKHVALPRWSLYTAGGLIVVSPYLLFRKQFEVWEKHPMTLAGSDALAMVVLFVGIMLAGALFLLAITRGGGWRRVAAWCAITILFFNGVIGLSRMILAMFLLLFGIVLLLHIRRRGILVALIAVLGVGLGALAYWNPRFKREHIEQSFAVRHAVRTEGWRMFTESPVLGVGYGREAFRSHWVFPSPPPLDTMPEKQDVAYSHSHNLWVHLLATQGLVGWAAFHILWGCVTLALIRAWHSVRRNCADDSSPDLKIRLGILQVGLLTLLLLQVNGLLMYPLQDCNEILFWCLGAGGMTGLSPQAHPPVA